MSGALIQEIGLGIQVHIYEDATWAVYLHNETLFAFGAEATRLAAMSASSYEAGKLYQREWEGAKERGELSRVATIDLKAFWQKGNAK